MGDCRKAMGNRQWAMGKREEGERGEFNAEDAKITQRCREEEKMWKNGRGR